MPAEKQLSAQYFLLFKNWHTCWISRDSGAGVGAKARSPESTSHNGKKQEAIKF